MDSIEIIENYVLNVPRDQFVGSLQLQDAVCRRLQIIGEASNNLPKDFIVSHSDISWKEIVGMRNFIIHEYFHVDLDLVWDTVGKSLPDLKNKLEKIKEEEDK